MKINLRKVNYVLIILSTILGGTVIIKYLDHVNIPGPLIKFLVLFFLIVGIFLERTEMRRSFLNGLMIIAGYLFMYFIFNRFNILNYLDTVYAFILIFLIFSYMLQKKDHFLDFCDTYVNIMLMIGIITVFFWLFGSVLNILPGRTAMTYTWALRNQTTYTYFYLYFENPVQNQQLLGSTLARNCGIYCEAPAFSGMLLYAIGIELFAHPEINKKKLGVLIATLMSTQSTKGLIVLIVIFGIRYFVEMKTETSKYNFAIKFVFAVILVIGSSFAVWYILEDKSGTASFAARLNHLQSGFLTFLQHPLFGAGYGNVSAIYENRYSGSGETGMSMGLAVLLAEGGIYLTGFYLFAIVFALRNRAIKGHKKNFLMFAMMILMNLFVSNSGFSYPYLFMVGSAYAAGLQVNRVPLRNIMKRQDLRDVAAEHKKELYL